MRRGRIVLTAVAVVLTVVALVVAVAGQVWLHGRAADDRRERSAREAAETAVAAVLSYDYRSLEANLAATRTLLTGDARQQYDDVSKPLLATAPGIHAITKAQVKTTAVLQSGERSARVLLFVDQLSSSTSLKTPRLDQSRIVVTVTRSGGRWLVSSLSAV
jgi:Mce-associated membrane protein